MSATAARIAVARSLRRTTSRVLLFELGEAHPPAAIGRGERVRFAEPPLAQRQRVRLGRLVGARAMQRLKEERVTLLKKLEIEHVELRGGEDYTSVLARFFRARGKRMAA